MGSEGLGVRLIGRSRVQCHTHNFEPITHTDYYSHGAAQRRR